MALVTLMCRSSELRGLALIRYSLLCGIAYRENNSFWQQLPGGSQRFFCCVPKLTNISGIPLNSYIDTRDLDDASQLDRGLSVKIWVNYRPGIEEVDLAVMQWKFKRLPVWMWAEYGLLLKFPRITSGRMTWSCFEIHQQGFLPRCVHIILCNVIDPRNIRGAYHC